MHAGSGVGVGARMERVAPALSPTSTASIITFAPTTIGRQSRALRARSVFVH